VTAIATLSPYSRGRPIWAFFGANTPKNALKKVPRPRAGLGVGLNLKTIGDKTRNIPAWCSHAERSNRLWLTGDAFWGYSSKRLTGGVGLPVTTPINAWRSNLRSSNQ